MQGERYNAFQIQGAKQGFQDVVLVQEQPENLCRRCGQDQRRRRPQQQRSDKEHGVLHEARMGRLSRGHSQRRVQPLLRQCQKQFRGGGVKTHPFNYYENKKQQNNILSRIRRNKEKLQIII